MGRTLQTTAYVGNVEVDVDIDELLEEVDTEDLIQELQDRGEDIPMTGLDLVYQCLLRNDLNGALVALEPLIHPRFPSTKAAEAVYRKAMAAKKESHA